MRFLFLLLFLLPGGIICSQTFTIYKNDTINRVDTGGKKQGYWIVFGKDQKNPAYKSDAKAEEGHYKNSQKTGAWISYWPNGNKKTEAVYVNNRPNGPMIIYFESGKKQEEGNWAGTRWTGPYKRYKEDGTVQQEFNYNPNGKREGSAAIPHPNGKIAIQVEPQKGEPVLVISKDCYPDSCQYLPAKRDSVLQQFISLYSEYCPCDSLQEKYFTDTADGYWRIETNNRTPYLRISGCFDDGKLQCGTAHVYDERGKLQEIRVYRYGTYAGNAFIPPGPEQDTVRKENTPEEKAAMKSAYDSLACQCDSFCHGQGKFNGEGAYVLYKNGRIYKKGCFTHYKLICGIDCVYDASGKLILIKKLEDGKATGEIPFPN